MKEIDGIEEYCIEHSTIFCYGAGLYGKTISAYLKGAGKDISGFIVSGLPNDKTIHERRVYSIEEFKQIYKPEMGIIVSVGPKYRNQIVDTLIENKIDDFICVSDELISYMQENGNFEYKYKSDNNITVLCYHRVIDVPLDTWKITVRNELFERELEYFKNHYIILNSDGEWKIPENRRGVVITFDDGYEDAYTNILPLLEKYDAPATFFISTCNLNTSDEFWWDELERIIYFSRRK